MSVPDRGPVVLAVTAAMIAGSTVFICMRMFSRAFILKKVTLDDWFILLAWVIAFGLSFIICYGTTFGLGQHESDVPDEHKVPLAKAEYVFTVLYNPALMATKTSIGVFYLSLAETQKIFKWMTIATLVIVNGVGLALTLVNILQCHPMSALFEIIRAPSDHCTDIVSLYLSSAPVNILTDLALLLLPMPLLKEMHLPRKQKIILYVTFGFGIFITAVDVVRISYLQQASVASIQEKLGQSTTSNQAQASDFSWYASLSFMWSAIEVNVGIMCACVPGLKPLFSKFLPNFIRSAGDKDGQRSSFNSFSSATRASANGNAFATAPSFMKETGTEEEEEGGEMGFLDFLSSPTDENELPAELRRTKTSKSRKSKASQKTSASDHFDFFNMAEEKAIVDMTNRESIIPIAEVTVLFFLWGFAYGLLGTLNAQFQTVAGMSPAQSQAIHSIYYVGYFIGPLTFGRAVLKTWGFKACYMVGLVVYGTGTLVFWPSAVLLSFGAFLVSNFIVGMGLSTLEIAANPFIALCGPLEYAEVRLNLSQAIQAVGSVVSPLLAKKALFNNLTNASSLIDVQWTYLAITLFTFLLAFVYYCITLPEGSDSDFARCATRNYSDETLSKLHHSKTIYITLFIGVFSQFMYVGGQEANSSQIATYLDYVTGSQISPTTVPWNFPNYEAICHTMFASSRFLAAFLGMAFQRYGLKPRYMLLFCYTGLILFCALASATSSPSFNVSPTTSAVFALMIYFFEGPLFSLIFAMPLRALGSHTKDGSAIMTAAIAGGAVFNSISNATSNARNPSIAMVVLVGAYGAGYIFPAYVNLWPLARKQVDPIHLDGTESEHDEDGFEHELEGGRIGALKQKGLSIFARSKKTSSDGSSKSDQDEKGVKRKPIIEDGVEVVEMRPDSNADGHDFMTSALQEDQYTVFPE